MGITEENVSTDGTDKSYKVKIKRFRHRMRNWVPGRAVRLLKIFQVAGCKLKLVIYPNGKNQNHKGWVSVYLMNESEESVQVKFQLKIDSIVADFDHLLKPSDDWGSDYFYQHVGGIIGDDEEDEDDRLAITCTVSEVWTKRNEDFKSSHQLAKASIKVAKDTRNEICHFGFTLGNNIKESQAVILGQMNTEFGGLESFLTEKFRQSVSSISEDLQSKFGDSEMFLRSSLEPLWIQLEKMKETMSKLDQNPMDSLPEHFPNNELNSFPKDEMREHFKQLKILVRSIEHRIKEVKIEKTDEYCETETPRAFNKMESFRDEINSKFSKLEALIARWFTTSDDHIKDRMKTSFLQHETSVQERLGAMETQIRELKDMLRTGINGSSSGLQKPVVRAPRPECPECRVAFSASGWIAQCSSGHLLCWECKQRPENAQCPTCLHPIIGRASGMESYIQILYKEISS